MIRKRCSQKEIPIPKTEVEKTKVTIRYFYLENISYSKPNEQLFLNRRLLSYPNITQTTKMHIRFKQHKRSTPKTGRVPARYIYIYIYIICLLLFQQLSGSTSSSVYSAYLPSPLRTRYVRIHPTSYQSSHYPTLKLEMYGCYLY